MSESLEALVVEALARLESQGEEGLDELCAAHPDHADALREKIARAREAGLTDTRPDAGSEEPATLEHIGPYRITGRIGAGGMGEVYRGEQTKPIQRTAAVKLIRHGMDSKQVLARFEAERQALTLMQHEGIAVVYDAGAAEGGLPYYAMEFVDGAPITEFCDSRKMTVRQRVELVARVCDAVHHAHQNGVIHRDLKPTNILVAERDGRAMPKVIDFGLAKAVEQRLTERTLQTEHGQIMGTPEYMSPEQADPDAAGIDVRTDVYALGVVLYELLTSRRPIMFGAQRPGLYEMLRAIREDDAPRPSTRVAAAGPAAATDRRAGDSKALARALRGDLDWIAMKALAKDRALRYRSVAELADDLRRHLRHEPVQAGPPSSIYVIRKFVRRRPAVVAALVVAVVAAVFVVGQEISYTSAIRERDYRAEQASHVVDLRRQKQRALAELLPLAPGERHDSAALRTWLAKTESLVGSLPEKQKVLAELVEHSSSSEGERRFEDPRDQISYEHLVAFIDDVVEFEGEGSVLSSVERRIDWTEVVERVTLDEAGPKWAAAIASIADRDRCPDYDGLRIEPQLGLIPLRRNPRTRLWEFRWFHPDGEDARWTDEDRVANRETFDPVFVLLPGSKFLMGAQTDDPNASNYDGAAPDIEKPPHEVELAPFFVSKYEITQAQWIRWAGVNPSANTPKRVAELHMAKTHDVRVDLGYPVDQISWTLAFRELQSWGLQLPTEAQWEYGARGRTTSAWWTGKDLSSLDGKVNLSDRTIVEWGVPSSYVEESLRDGFGLAAPVDALAPNGFGLYHVAGNMWEWCRDPYRNQYPGTGETGHRPGDGLLTSDVEENPRRPARGGAFTASARSVRSAKRVHQGPGVANYLNGVRPARALVSR